jgi:hypothetical protein
MSAHPTDTQARRPGDGDAVHRVLILANEVIGDDALVREIMRHVEGRPAEVRIVSPAIVESPLDLAAGDVDDEIEEARRRLDASIAALEQKGITASGGVGDADPNLALEDGLRLFPADEVIMVVHPRERRSWLEEDVVERAKRTVHVPVTVIEVDSEAGPPAVRDVRHVAPAAGAAEAERRQEARDADYLPPMPREDRAALFVGPLGCIALALLAIDCQGDFHVNLDTADVGCITSYVLGVYALIVTAIHVPAILVLQGERYAGGLKRFMSLTVLFGIPAAVVVAAIAVLVS